MKRLIPFVFALISVLGLAGCINRSMNYIIENEPSVTGIVKEVHDNFIIINLETENYPSGTCCEVSLDVENKDSYTSISVGDEVVVYYDGEIKESDPLQMNTEYAITLRTPADRETE